MGVKPTSMAEIVEAAEEASRLMLAHYQDQHWRRRLRPGDRVLIEGAPVAIIQRIEWREQEQFVQIPTTLGRIWIDAGQILGRAP